MLVNPRGARAVGQSLGSEAGVEPTHSGGERLEFSRDSTARPSVPALWGLAEPSEEFSNEFIGEPETVGP
jgi:hypothetical protein